jgi:hypothetical protein
MATYFIDLDGTFFKFGTQDPLPDAPEAIRQLEEKGHKIVWATMRVMSDQKLGYTATIRRFRELGIKSETIVWECPSPRVVVNDDGARAVNHPRNGPLTYDSLA